MTKTSQFSRRLMKTAALGALALATLGGATAAQAADAAATSAGPANKPEEIVVTANKKEEVLHNVANSITAVSARDLETRAQTDFQDFAAQVPGLQIQQISSTLNRLIIRGENAGGGAANVGTVIDDMPLSYSTGNANGSITTTNPDTFDMQRVEVLRGPQGTLYGAGAEGGLLKYVTNKPVFNKLQAGVEVGGMTVNHGQSVADGKAYLNVPVSDTFALRASGFYEDLPGWISNAATGEKYANRGFRYGARVTALWEPTKDLKVTAQAATQQLHSQGPNVVDLVGSALDPAAPPANQFALAHGLSLGAPTSNFSEGTEYYAYVNIDYDAHFARITSITSHGILGSTFKQDESGGEIAPGLTYGQFFGPGGPVPIYTVPVYNAQANPTRLYKTTQELRVSSEPGFQLGVTPVEWQFGGMITRELTHWQQYADFFAVSDPNGPPLEPRGGYAELNAPYYEKAAFADATVHFAPEFDLEAGVRYSNIIQTSQIHLHCCVLFGPDAVLPALHTSQDHADWSVAPRLHFGKDTLLYARIASGFRAGGPELIIPNAPPGFPLSYKPDHTVNYELGLRTYLFDRAVSIDVAAYYITWTDVQVSSVFATAAGPFTVQGNAGKASSTGVEWNLSFVPTPGLTLGIVGDYDDAKLTADADGLGGKNGDPLSFVPDFVNTVNLDYHQKAFNDYEFYIGGTWTHTGHFYNDFVAPASAGLLGSRVQLPAYDTLAMQAGLRNGRFDYELYVHNLSDSRALLSYANSGGFNFFGQGAILQPRTFGFRISYKY